MNRTRIDWIDALRGIAIIAVAVDHALYVFPVFDPGLVKIHTYFSIPWFIFLSGYTNALSAAHRPSWDLKRITLYLARRLRILIPYVLASAICYLILWYPRYSLREFASGVLNFRIQGSYYFINLILQLSLVFPLLYRILKRLHGPLVWVAFAVIAEVSHLLMRVNPVWPFTPAGRYFGGVYLLIFSLGILAALKGLPRRPAAFLFFGIAFAAYEYLVLTTRGSFVWLVPNLQLTSWSLSLLVLSYGLTGILRYVPPVGALLIILGRHSLTIYLYHFMILYLARRLGAYGLPDFLLLATLAIMLPASLGISWAYVCRLKNQRLPSA